MCTRKSSFGSSTVVLTLLYHSGANLSVGQGQLIAFARAVAARASSLFSMRRPVLSIQSPNHDRTRARGFYDKTVIAIAHRLSTIRGADKILVRRRYGSRVRQS